MKFRIKEKTFFRIWLIFTIVLCIILTSGFFVINGINRKTESLENLDINKYVYGLPKMEVFEREVEVVKNIDNVSYTFPFEVSECKTVKTVGSCNCCLPSKKYSNMKIREDVTVFASPSFYAEGSLVWIEGVGIRQVQPLSVNSDKLHICFSSHEDAIKYGEKSVKIYDIKE